MDGTYRINSLQKHRHGQCCVFVIGWVVTRSAENLFAATPTYSWFISIYSGQVPLVYILDIFSSLLFLSVCLYRWLSCQSLELLLPRHWRLDEVNAFPQQQQSENKCKLSSILFIAVSFLFRASNCRPKTKQRQQHECESKKFNKNRNELPPRLTTEEYFYFFFFRIQRNERQKNSSAETHTHTHTCSAWWRPHASRIISSWENVRATDSANYMSALQLCVYSRIAFATTIDTHSCLLNTK